MVPSCAPPAVFAYVLSAALKCVHCECHQKSLFIPDCGSTCSKLGCLCLAARSLALNCARRSVSSSGLSCTRLASARVSSHRTMHTPSKMFCVSVSRCITGSPSSSSTTMPLMPPSGSLCRLGAASTRAHDAPSGFDRSSCAWICISVSSVSMLRGTRCASTSRPWPYIAWR